MTKYRDAYWDRLEALEAIERTREQEEFYQEYRLKALALPPDDRNLPRAPAAA
ncbi:MULTISPECIES: hypothetical protein [Micrococcales]|jgi:hypothetical protein|uniref:hypothetical protein n=1 Tax=Micrococcales TaxID=85006 RepID=UPI0013052E4C|nr:MULTISPECIES: hypothetical protein [Micrococcales]MCK8476979.1 hypothetical protein [Microbacterium aurugineum]MCT1375941.1 hypothetical protein [Microbacterium sp. p3-SID337]MCT2223507.1 hypothetical protein [Microbacterium paraoxydans]